MDALLSAVASDLVGRSISFIVEKYKNLAAPNKLARLQRLLLRARTVVDEAEARQIANQGMLLQLKQLREVMYRGHYVLDTFKIRTAQSKRRDHQVSESFNLSKLQNDSENLEATLGDMKEFLLLLMHCPPIIGRQPYSAYLFMERCMFGRHMEKEQVIYFLLQPCSSLDVLPVIGPCYAGKSTLVEHVCREERVQRNFSQIVHFKCDDLNNLANDSTMVNWKSSPSEGRSLIVIELVRDTDEAAWKRLYPSMCRAGSGSKVILISRMDQVSSLGTVQALRLGKLHQEEYWYFFKVLAFGSANPCDEHPELVPIAKKIATEISGSFIGGSLVSRLLRANLNAQFWHQVLGVLRKSIQVDTLVFGEDPRVGKRYQNYFCSHNNGPLISCYSRRKSGCNTQADLPSMTEALTAVPYGEEFDVLLWQSPIPPYYNYILTCVIEKSQKIDLGNKGLKRKRVAQSPRIAL